MAENVVLKFFYMGNEVDLMIEDIDKVMCIDMIMDFEDGSRKRKYDMPSFPCFHYCYKRDNHYIECDKDLMTMLERLGNQKVIYVYVGTASKPLDCVIAARRLSETLKQRDNVYFGRSLPKKNTQELVDDGINHAQEEYWVDVVSEPVRTRVEKLPFRRDVNKKLLHSNDLIPKTSATTSFSNAPLPLNPVGTSSNMKPKKIVGFMTKIPRTTAARKGLIKSGINDEPELIINEQFNEVLHQNSNVDQGSGISNNDGVDNDEEEGECNAEFASVQEDILLSKKKKKKGGDVFDDASQSDEEGDVNENSNDHDYVAAIHDNFDLYADDCWQANDDDETYFSKLYKNGEMYTEEEFGKIVLKPWMMFADKKHFKSVLKDYCIQCNFCIVVNKSSPTRFTANCKDLNCGWRIHSSRLPDGKTWAIKSIQNSEHTCRGLDCRNPLVDAIWAQCKDLQRWIN